VIPVIVVLVFCDSYNIDHFHIDWAFLLYSSLRVLDFGSSLLPLFVLSFQILFWIELVDVKAMKKHLLTC
jgi:hypothetical protein